jgi:hypothetical protein
MPKQQTVFSVFARMKLKEIISIGLMAIALGSFFLFMYFKLPDWRRPSGFGPEWQCTPTGRGGPDFCIKKSLLAPPKQAKSPKEGVATPP